MADIKFWVGVGFGVVSLLFFIIAYFLPPRSDGQYVILRVIASLLAGAAGLFLSGEVFTQFIGEVSSELKLTVSATGAIALFVLVWLTFPKAPATLQTSIPGPGWKISFPLHTTFRQAANVIRDINGASLSLRGFQPGEENVVLASLSIDEATQAKAFKRLADLAPPNFLPPYEVLQTNLHFELIAKRS